jgi:Icc-related predicted phosphoesterase
MKILNAICRLAFFLFLAAVFFSCDTWFAYSPYEAQLDPFYHATNSKNLERLKALNSGDSRAFKVALLSDPHYHYGKLEDAIAHINQDSSYAFALVGGDLTENGLKQEFVFFHETMARLRIPYLTVIGNHDYLSNGEVLYQQMYGSYNYTFVFNNVKFVLFDNNTIESEKEPDFEWFAEELVNNNGYDRVVPVAHIPPYDVQMERYHKKYHELIARNQIPLSIHGHRHDFSEEYVYGDGIRYVTISSPQKRTYTALSISPQGVDVRKIEY